MKKNTFLFFGSILMIGGSLISCQKNEIPPKKQQASSLVTYNPCSPSNLSTPGAPTDYGSPINPCSPTNPNSPITPCKPYTPQNQLQPNQMNPSSPMDRSNVTPNYNSSPPSYNPCSP